MKRYLEHHELQALFFRAYFLYGKVKYGSSGYSDKRLGAMTAYKSIMQLYRPFVVLEHRVRTDAVMERFDYLESKAKALRDDGFKRAFLKTLKREDPRRRLPES